MIASSISTLTTLEAVVFKAFQADEAFVATGFSPETMQAGIPEAYQKIRSKVTPQQFSVLCGSLAKKGLYNHILCDDESFPKKTIDGMVVRRDIAEVVCLEYLECGGNDIDLA
jgi:hypothetical protein